MARKLTITLIVLFGFLGLGSSRPAFEDDESFAFDEEEARVYEDERVYDQEEAQAYDEEALRAYDEALAEFKSQYEEIRVNAGYFKSYSLQNFYLSYGCYAEKRRRATSTPRVLVFLLRPEGWQLRRCYKPSCLLHV